MSTLILANAAQKTPAPLPLDDLVERYCGGEVAADAPWLVRLRLESPRRNIRCLSAAVRFLKRAADIVLSSALLLILSPVMAATALAVRFTSAGPVIFRQERVGLNEREARPDRRRSGAGTLPDGVERRLAGRRQSPGYGRVFTLYKFRTMRVDAEKFGAQFAEKDDPRVTPIGRFLRRTRLDEVPQLWNVLRGDMSLVGPRPERPVFIEQLSAEIPNYLDRLGLKPGLTGLAQVENGYDNNLESFRRKVSLDLLYLQNCCLANDLRILWRTIGVVVTGKGAL